MEVSKYPRNFEDLKRDFEIAYSNGEDYTERINEVVENTKKARTLEKVIDNCFQQVVHSMNMPAGNRG